MFHCICFAFFNVLPLSAKFGFGKRPTEFNSVPSSKNLVKYVKKAQNLKDLFVGLIHSHNASMLEQFLIPDYESLLNKLLQVEDLD